MAYRGLGLLVFGLSHCDPSRVPSQWPLRQGTCHRECLQVAHGQVTITENIWWPWKVNTLVWAERAKRAIYNNRKYLTLGGCMVLEGPIYSNEQRAIYNNRKYFTLGRCLVLEGQYIKTSREQCTITENISLWEGVWYWKANTFKRAESNLQ